jgi:hypothetical protein
MDVTTDPTVGLAYFGRGLTAEEFAELQGRIVDTASLQRDVMSLDRHLFRCASRLVVQALQYQMPSFA